MAKMPKRNAWSKVIEEHGVAVRLFDRGGTIYRAVKLGRTVSASGKPRTRQDVRSMKHGDRALAEKQARDLCAELAMSRLTGGRAEGLTLMQLFAQYRLHRLPTLASQRAQYARSRMALFTAAWGRELPLADLSQSHADVYISRRRAGELVAPGIAGQGRESYAVREGTLDSDFRWLASVFNWARKHKVRGKRLLGESPLDDIEWPKEKNVRRPVATHARFLRTVEHADAVDKKGRLRCILTLARYTGRRESAICSLQADSLLLTTERIAARLAELGRDEGLAAHASGQERRTSLSPKLADGRIRQS
jgi:hypothetical protein